MHRIPLCSQQITQLMRQTVIGRRVTVNDFTHNRGNGVECRGSLQCETATRKRQEQLREPLVGRRSCAQHLLRF